MKKKKKTPANNFNDEKLFFKKTLPILTVLYYIFFVKKRPFLTKIKSNQIKTFATYIIQKINVLKTKRFKMLFA